MVQVHQILLCPKCNSEKYKMITENLGETESETYLECQNCKYKEFQSRTTWSSNTIEWYYNDRKKEDNETPYSIF